MLACDSMIMARPVIDWKSWSESKVSLTVSPVDRITIVLQLQNSRDVCSYCSFFHSSFFLHAALPTLQPFLLCHFLHLLLHPSLLSSGEELIEFSSFLSFSSMGRILKSQSIPGSGFFFLLVLRQATAFLANLHCDVPFLCGSERTQSSAAHLSQFLCQPLKWFRYSGVLLPLLSFPTTNRRSGSVGALSRMRRDLTATFWTLEPCWCPGVKIHAPPRPQDSVCMRLQTALCSQLHRVKADNSVFGGSITKKIHVSLIGLVHWWNQPLY